MLKMIVVVVVMIRREIKMMVKEVMETSRDIGNQCNIMSFF